MSVDIRDLIDRARVTATRLPQPGEMPTPAAQRDQIARVAQEFESMLLKQVLQDMRQSGSWDEDGDREGLGAETFAETIDGELASYLSRGKGFGLSRQLLDAFDRLLPTGAPAPAGSAPPAGPATAPVAMPAQSPVSEPGPPAPPASSAAGDMMAATTAPVSRADAGPAAKSRLSGFVTSQFGWRTDPFTGTTRFHKGIDLRAAYGQDVQAAGDGRVVFSGEQKGYGTTVMVEHADGTRTRYAHLSAALVPVGATVSAGQPLGRAGHSGRATGTHVHFEVLDANGHPIPPDAWMQG